MPLKAVVCVLLSSFSWSASEWPAEEDHLIFLFQDMNEEIYAFLPGDDEPLFDYGFKREGFATTSASGALQPAQGRFIAPNQGKTLKAAMTDAKGFALQVHVTTPKDMAGKQVILTLGSQGGEPDFALYQEGSSLSFSLNADAGRLNATAPLPSSDCRLAVSADAGGLTLYVNGQQVTRVKGNGGSYTNWSGGELTIGAGEPGRAGWHGQLDGLALFTKSLDAETIAADSKAFSQMQSMRREPRQLYLKARLVAKSKLPTLKDISPYSESLAVFEYEIVEVTKGMILANRIRIAHWTILGGQYTPYRDAPIGTVTEMVVEPFRANRQLKTVNMSDSLPLDPKGDNYYDASRMALRWQKP